MHIEKVLPSEIEKESFRIISEELQKELNAEQAPVIKRVIHTTADFEYADSLYFSHDVIRLAKNALKSGVCIVTDTQMAFSGINKKAAEKLGAKVYCFMSDEDVAKEAKQQGVTRAAVSMDKAVRLGDNVIFAIGNAPTALIRLREHIDAGYKPKLIIGVPVGFVNVVASKEMIIDTDIPCIVARGRKGGSNVAACIVNALLYELDTSRGGKSADGIEIRRVAGRSIIRTWQNAVPSPSEEIRKRSAARWDSIAKPLRGLGKLEDAVTRIAALTGKESVRIDKRAVVVMCADNGVVEEGVTQTDASVTAIMANCIKEHKSSVCLMAKSAGADVFAVDMGINTPVDGVLDMHVRRGTGNIAKGAAMTETEALQAIQNGISVADSLKDKGYNVIVTGEMGIGNTTTSSALAAVLLEKPVEEVTGRGAGLSDEGLIKKRDAIKRAIAVNKPDKNDVLGVLAKVGGLDIAGLAGLYIGAAKNRIPILIDGLPSSVAAYIAYRLVPECINAMIATHVSAEPVAEEILRRLGLSPVIYADMKLGEGTGAVCMLPLIDAALAVYNSTASFSDVKVEQYVPQGG